MGSAYREVSTQSIRRLSDFFDKIHGELEGLTVTHGEYLIPSHIIWLMSDLIYNMKYDMVRLSEAKNIYEVQSVKVTSNVLNLLKKLCEQTKSEYSERIQEKSEFSPLAHKLCDRVFGLAQTAESKLKSKELNLNQIEWVAGALGLNPNLESLQLFCNEFNSVNSNGKVDQAYYSLCENYPIGTKTVSLDGSKDLPWRFINSRETPYGNIYELSQGNALTADLWMVTQKFPIWCQKAGVYSTSDRKLIVGDAEWVNHNLDLQKNTPWDCSLRFLNWHPENEKDSINCKKFSFSPNFGLKTLYNSQVLLADNFHAWFHDRFAHLMGYVAVGQRPRIFQRFMKKVKAFQSLEVYLHKKFPSDSTVEKLLLLRSHELYRIFDYATANIVGLLSEEDPFKLPQTIDRFRGFHILAGQTPQAYSLKRKFRNDATYIRRPEDYYSVKTIADAIYRELLNNGYKVSAESLWTMVESFHFEPLSVEEACYEFLQIPLFGGSH